MRKILIKGKQEQQQKPTARGNAYSSRKEEKAAKKHMKNKDK